CSQLGDDMEMTLSALYGLSCNPNAAAVLILGLGCENGNINEWLKRFPDFDADRVKFLNCQDVDDELTVGEKILEKLCALADDDRRTLCDASDLVIGLKCGGSDGFSGITANALLGKFTDALVSEGGSAILTEVPEMFGAEQILMNRAVNKDVFENTVNLINNFKKYFLRYGEPVDENPSPGNKEGGITTLAEKSLGCVQKGGTAPVMDVLPYAEGAKEKGLSLLNAPGNDLVASCALAASGAQIVLFTTGRGTPFACPVPTVKISSNTNLFEKKSAWIDFNAGVLLDGEDADAVADRFYDFVLQIAEGNIKTKSEKLDKSSFAIWKDGVTL
ncbi:MAG: UxaA family hydrolase, partial [Acutalibacteraceae bacterium]|nr:UxaA family hydrolase [Acutalibacteraceae bacterium]